MPDRILETFLARQHDEGMALCRQSDLVELRPIGPAPIQKYVAAFRCTGLCRTPDGQIAEMPYSEVGIFFPDHYLRHSDPYQILMWLGPQHVWHPNIGHHVPLICLGRLGPGTRLTDILYQLFEIITYQRFATHDALNHDAAAWARQNQHRFPVDRRPLKRRRIVFTVDGSPHEERAS
jgi:hypothetical protein